MKKTSIIHIALIVKKAMFQLVHADWHHLELDSFKSLPLKGILASLLESSADR